MFSRTPNAKTKLFAHRQLRMPAQNGDYAADPVGKTSVSSKKLLVFLFEGGDAWGWSALLFQVDQESS